MAAAVTEAAERPEKRDVIMKRVGKMVLNSSAVILLLAGYLPVSVAAPIRTDCASPGESWSVDFKIFGADGKKLLGHHHAEGNSQRGGLKMSSSTEFTDGQRWEEDALLELGELIRPQRYKRRYRGKDGKWETVEIDFQRGVRMESVQGVEETKKVDLPPDTYIGPMIALAVRCAAKGGTVDFHSMSFQHFPGLHAMKVRALGEEPLPWGPKQGRSALRVLLKADLGSVANFLLGPVIPDNNFWIKPGADRQVLAWDGPSDWAGAKIVSLQVQEDGSSEATRARRLTEP